MELIDRRKLVSDFWKGVEDGSILSYEDTDDLMENAPTVDAVEVVHGEWRLVQVDAGKKTAVVECSVCDAVFEVSLSSLVLNYNYSSNCGADIR